MNFQRGTLIKSLTVMTVCTAIFFSCKKDSNSNSDPGTSNPANDSAMAMSTSAATTDNLYNDTYDVLALTVSNNNYLNVRQATEGGREQGVDSVPGCTTINVTPADLYTYPKTVVVDFGTGCTGWYGVVRSGKITYTLSNMLKLPGTTVTAVYDNYKVNGYKVEGSYSLTNNSSLSAGVVLNSSITKGKVTWPDGVIWYSYSGTKTVKQTAGVGSTNYNDYVFAITGAHSYASWTGRTLYDSVTTALVKATTCRNISAGIVDFTYNGTVKGTLDYGNGTCDTLATIKIGTWVKTIGLPK